MFKHSLEKLRDWWRGYTFADVLAVHDKFKAENFRPGEIVPITELELKALTDPARIYLLDSHKMLSHNGKSKASYAELDGKTPWMGA